MEIDLGGGGGRRWRYWTERRDCVGGLADGAGAEESTGGVSTGDVGAGAEGGGGSGNLGIKYGEPVVAEYGELGGAGLLGGVAEEDHQETVGIAGSL
jgi:hypothetical protein